MNLSFPYKTNPAKMALGGFFFAACAAFIIRRAITNDRGLIINGLIELGEHGATVFYVVLATLSVGFVVVAAASTVHGMIHRPVLLLTDEHLVIPAGFLRRRPRTVRFAEITRMTMQEVQKQRFLNVWTAHGKSSIVHSLLPSDAAFEEVIAHIRGRTPHLADGE